MAAAKIKRYVIKALKIAVWLFASFVLLFLIISIALQFSSVQTWLITRITSQVSERVETPFSIDRVAIRFPKSVGLKGIYAEDTQGDTLLYAGSIFVDVGMLGLLRNTVNVNSLELSNVVANMTRNRPDTVYNYQFLIDAFAGSTENDTIVESEYVENDQTNDSSSTAWQIVIKKVELQKIYYRLADHFSGIDLTVALEEFTTNLGDADVLAKKYHMGKTLLIRPEITLKMSEPSKPSEPDTVPSELPVLDLALDQLITDDIQFIYSSFNGTSMNIGAVSLLLSPDNIQLHKNLYEVNELISDQFYAHFVFPETTADKSQTVSDDSDESSSGEKPFIFDFSEIMDYTVKLNNLGLNNSAFSMKQGNPGPSSHFDSGNISLNNIQVQLSDITVSPNELILDIDQLAMIFSDDFQLEDFQANINLGGNSLIDIQNLTTNQSKVAFRFESTDNLLYFSSDEIDNVQFDLSIAEILIQKDLAWLVPTMNDYYFSWPKTKGIRLQGKLSGVVSDLDIDNFSAEAPGFFNTQISGHFKNITNPDSLWIDMHGLKIEAIPGPFFANLPDSLAPAGLQLPERITLEARAKGSRQDFSLTTEILSDFGNAKLAAELKTADENTETFALDFSTDGFDVGKLMGQQEMLTEPLEFQLTANGKGLNPQTMALEATATIENLHLNQYAYQPLKIEMQLADSTASVKSQYQDEYLSFDLESSFAAFKQIPELMADVRLNYGQFQKLGFVDDDLLVKVSLNTHLLFNVDDFFSGDLIISDAAFARDGEIYEIPELTVYSDADDASYGVSISSPFLTANYQGNISPTALPKELINHFSDYFEMPGFTPDSTVADTVKRFEFTLALLPHDVVTQIFMNQISEYDTLNMKASYNNLDSELSLDINWPGLDYGSMDLKDFTAKIVSNRQAMRYQVNLSSFMISDITLHQFNVQGDLKNQELTYTIAFSDVDDNPLYRFPGSLQIEDSIYHIKLNHDNLLLNGEKWKLSADNMIKFGNKTLDIKNFDLRKDDKHLILLTRQDDNYGQLLDAKIRQIDLGRLTDFSGNNLPTLGGLLNGEFTVRDIFETPGFTADIDVDNFAFGGDTLGNISVKAENPESNRFNLFASLQGNLTDLALEGFYKTGEAEEINLDVDLQKLDLASFEAFTAGSLTQLNGFLNGKIEIRGNTTDPIVDGQVNFNETTFQVSAINSSYFIDKQSIVFNNQNIRLNNFTIKDSDDLKASLDGHVDFSDLSMLGFDLNVKSLNFQFMDVKPTQDENYHGKILISSDLRLHGTQTLPIVEGTVKLNESSKLTYTLPQSTPENIGDEGIIEFIQTGDTVFSRLASEAATDQASLPSFEQFDMSVNIEIDPKTDVKIIIDQYAGDFLQVKGGGVLSFGMDPGGRISLSGRYEISHGEYLLTFYDVVRRNFKIQQGSSITWSGNPLEAEMDITALYTERTSPANLLASSSGQDQSSSMRQQIPFIVSLMMKEKLMSPQISFKLGLPPEFQNAFSGSLASRLEQINQNESELNKQVFSLLIIGNFLPDNPLDAMGGGGDFASTARSSASQILTQQLNRLSDQFIRGVDINFDVQSSVDYSQPDAAGRTELQMEVSRNFFDERVKVTVGSNIELEDKTGRENKPGDIAGDFSIEYMITPEGNLILKGFRTKTYDDIFEDQLYETGLSLIFSRSYNRFRDLFRKDEEATITDEK